MEVYRVRKSLTGKCVLQEYVTFPNGLPDAPDPQWVDVDYKNAPTSFVCRVSHLNKVHELEQELVSK